MSLASAAAFAPDELVDVDVWRGRDGSPVLKPPEIVEPERPRTWRRHVRRFGSVLRLLSVRTSRIICRRRGPQALGGASGNHGKDEVGTNKGEEGLLDDAAETNERSRQLKAIAFVSLAALISFSSRSVLSIVIPQVADDLSLSTGRCRTALSSFFYGYVVTNAASSVLLQLYQPKKMLLFSVFSSSVCTVALPIAINVAGYRGLVVCRVLSGLTQGCLFPALYGFLGAELASDSMLKTRALAVLGGVAQLGIAANFLGSPMLVTFGGWQLAVTVPGCMGFPWCLLWTRSEIFQSRSAYPKEGAEKENAPSAPVPYRDILTTRPFQALVCGHFAHNWTATVVMAWLPTYLSQELHVAGRSLGVSCLPYVAMAGASPLAGALAEHMLKRRWDLWAVRRAMSVGALLCPAAGLLVFPHIPEEWWPMPLVCVTLVMAFTTWSSASVLASPLDLAGPKLSGVLFAITNGICAVPSFMGIEVSGAVRERYGWATAFASCSIIYAVASCIYLRMGSACRVFD